MKSPNFLVVEESSAVYGYRYRYRYAIQLYVVIFMCVATSLTWEIFLLHEVLSFQWSIICNIYSCCCISDHGTSRGVFRCPSLITHITWHHSYMPKKRHWPNLITWGTLPQRLNKQSSMRLNSDTTACCNLNSVLDEDEHWSRGDQGKCQRESFKCSFCGECCEVF